MLTGNYAIDLKAVDSLTSAYHLYAAKTQPTATSKKPLTIINGDCHIQAVGYVFPRANFLTAFGLGFDLESLKADLNQAANQPNVKQIIINFDSPGGNVSGVSELAQFIHTLNKPMLARVTGLCCSAAYWLASACRRIETSDTGILGSIGVVSIQRRPDNGVIEIVSTFAADKRPDPTTDHGQTVIRKTLDDLEAVFQQSITTFRPLLTLDKIKSLKGSVLVGQKAIDYGLADQLTGEAVTMPPTTTVQDGGWKASFNQAMNPKLENPIAEITHNFED